MNAIVQPKAARLPEMLDIDTQCIEFDTYQGTGTVALVCGDDYVTVEFTAEKTTCHAGHTGPIDYYGGCQDVYAEVWKVSATVTVVDSDGFEIQPGTEIVLWGRDHQWLEEALNDQHPAEEDTSDYCDY